MKQYRVVTYDKTELEGSAREIVQGLLSTSRSAHSMSLREYVRQFASRSKYFYGIPVRTHNYEKFLEDASKTPVILVFEEIVGGEPQ